MAIVQLRVDDELKAQAAAIYDRLGIDMSSAIRMFLKRTVNVNCMPFSVILNEEEYNPQLALQAMKNINASAKANGISEMTLDEINEEISAYRKERKSHK